ncbi:MAG: hypothetical protein WC145_09215 [Aliarcobacter sp.]|jgi:hypothetical protein
MERATIVEPCPIRFRIGGFSDGRRVMHLIFSSRMRPYGTTCKDIAWIEYLHTVPPETILCGIIDSAERALAELQKEAEDD